MMDKRTGLKDYYFKPGMRSDFYPDYPVSPCKNLFVFAFTASLRLCGKI
jgi:hypothetical protein